MTETASGQQNHAGRRIRIRGIVQGVGFRPTVWRLAHEHSLVGQVRNDSHGVLIKAWGPETQIEAFIASLHAQCPPLARIDHIDQQTLPSSGHTDFHISQSLSSEAHTAIAADAASCKACIEDIQDSQNRRYRYPFTNCTHCGPRLSIINAIPYDRSNTSMATFELCRNCRHEYENPADRRFHAQPNACPDCGPHVWLSPRAENISGKDDVDIAQTLLKQGHILAIKGIGGFHLACDGSNHQAVSLLRERKRRYAKPFALMARDIGVIQKYCKMSDAETALLNSSEAPIVLLDRNSDTSLAGDIALGGEKYGFMLPYTPLHHLLLSEFESPIVMTSGNISELPQCTENDEALEQLEGIADYFLLHNRDISNRMDDSVVRLIHNKSRLLRRARGYTPCPIPLPGGFENAPEMLAYGAELKNTFCLIKDQQAVLGQHMGDLENASTFEDYEKNINLFQHLFALKPRLIAIDKHPEYLSSKLGRANAAAKELPLVEVQHHHAHIAACLTENAWPRTAGKVLGIALDGIGFGDDGTIWGGEFLLTDYHSSQRLACFKPIALIGAGQAMREPWRNTYAHLVAAFGSDGINDQLLGLPLFDFLDNKPLATIEQMLAKGVNSPLASSCGRLFDAVAAAVGLCRDNTLYEGQAAIELESAVDESTLNDQQEHAYRFDITKDPGSDLTYIEPTPMWQGLLGDLQAETPIPAIAARFHLGLADAICAMVEHLRNNTSSDFNQCIALSGGVYQNRILFEQVEKRLTGLDYKVFSHSQVPANDGGIALGQAVIALAQHLNQETPICA